MHLYVYYDVPHAEAPNVVERVRAMQSTLEHDRSKVRLMRRTEPGAASATWMEIYENVAEGFEDRLAASVERHGLGALTGPRHVERFTDIV